MNDSSANAQETYVFVAALDKANEFGFDKLVPWLRERTFVHLEFAGSKPLFLMAE